MARRSRWEPEPVAAEMEGAGGDWGCSWGSYQGNWSHVGVMVDSCGVQEWGGLTWQGAVEVGLEQTLSMVTSFVSSSVERVLW